MDCNRTVKQQLAAALAEGKSSDEVFDMIPADTMVKDAPSEEDAQRNLIVYCPVSRCGKQAQGRFAAAAMKNHVYEAHPDWKGAE
jgi:rhodanese-related sulfurtransferase